jgi:hypothetical protein
MLGMIVAFAAQAAVPMVEHAPDGRPEIVREFYPRLVGSPVMKRMRGYCQRYHDSKTTAERTHWRQALVSARRNYQGDLSQEVYQCMIATHAIRR